MTTALLAPAGLPAQAGVIPVVPVVPGDRVVTSPREAAPVAGPGASPRRTAARTSRAVKRAPAVRIPSAQMRALRCIAIQPAKGLKPWPNAVRSRIKVQFRIATIGGYRPGSGSSDHHTGNALDVMIPRTRKATGDAVAAWAVRHRARLKVSYVIWYQRIWLPGQGWRHMPSRGSVTANHYDHVHISFTGARGTCPR